MKTEQTGKRNKFTDIRFYKSAISENKFPAIQKTIGSQLTGCGVDADQSSRLNGTAEVESPTKS